MPTSPKVGRLESVNTGFYCFSAFKQTRLAFLHSVGYTGFVYVLINLSSSRLVLVDVCGEEVVRQVFW